MSVWLSSLFKTDKNKKETPAIEKKEDEDQVNIRPSLDELKLLKAISELNQIGILEIILNSPTLNRVSNSDMISWNVYCRFLEEINIMDQLEPEQVKEFYSLISTPNLLPVLHELYKDAGRRTVDLIQARDEKTKDEIDRIISMLREYNFKQLITRANMIQASITV